MNCEATEYIVDEQGGFCSSRNLAFCRSTTSDIYDAMKHVESRFPSVGKQAKYLGWSRV